MSLKKKEKLTAYWDKKENCIGAYHPLGFMTQADAHYLFDNVFTKEFVKEITDRGYDVTTMKFEISPKLPNYERFNDLSKKYYGNEKQCMEKRIILDEQDINEFHSDADVLQWIYNLITKEYLISECSKNIPRFARIIDKLKKLQRMKIRQAKKIIKPSFRNGKIGYWHSRYDLYCMGFDGCKDHRITKAISLFERWNARRYRNEAAKLNKKNPFRPRDIRRSVERLKQYSA